MEIRATSVIRHPLARVYRAYKDELPEIAPFIPDVKEIRALRREEIPGGTKLLNLWVAGREIPRVAQGVLKPEMLQWEDHATWDDAAHAVDWQIRLPAFPERVRCGGRNRFEAEGSGATRVIISGDLRINLENFPGIPRFLSRTVTPAVERFIVELITPNLTRVNGALERYLDSR